ncbi:MAG: FAD-dependent oxidoreductase [Nanoarchaeota archaeon]
MLYENWLHISSLNIKTSYCPPLQKNISCECLVIGGGITGLHAALKLVEAGKKDVVLLEKRICGSGSSGQSGGFVSPESEEDMNAVVKDYGKEKAKIIYSIPLKGLQLIKNTIKKHNFKCDFRKQDTLFLSIKKSHDNQIREEANVKKENGLPYEILDEKKLKNIHPGKGYDLAMKFPGSFGMNCFAYCIEMKNLLLKKHVRIYEDSEVNKIEGNTARTHLGSVKARNILVCMDKVRKEFDEEISKKIYHIQTYVAVSEPLSEEQMKSLFPKEELMCWGTGWDYIYYRPVEGNRLLVGGSSPWTAYYPTFYHSPKVIEYCINEIKYKFPKIKDIRFTHYWSGLIDATKDLIPIVDYDPKNKSIQYALGCAGLNWAAYCGDYLARRVINPKETEDLKEFFGMHRKFYFSDLFQKIFGKRITFALSHLRKFLK